MVIPNRAEGEGFGFFLEGEASGVVAFEFGSLDARRFEQGDEERAKHVAGADDPRGDAVDAGVEVIETDVDAIGIVVGDDFASDGEEIVREGYDVITIPANATANVEHDLREKLENAGDFVRDGFGWVIVTGIEGEEFFARDGVANVKFVRADDVAFGADAEEFWFHRIEIELR